MIERLTQSPIPRPSLQNWKDALLAYQQAQAQLPENLANDDPALRAWRDRISTGIALAQGQLGMNQKR